MVVMDVGGRSTRGHTHYFAGGRGKSDRDAYNAALAVGRLKVSIDQSTPRTHQTEYEAAIKKQFGLEFSAQEFPVCGVGNQQAGGAATKAWCHQTFSAVTIRLVRIRVRPLRDRQPSRILYKVGPAGGGRRGGRGHCARANPRHFPLPQGDFSLASSFTTKRLIDRAVWRDRLTSLQRQAAPSNESLQCSSACT